MVNFAPQVNSELKQRKKFTSKADSLFTIGNIICEWSILLRKSIVSWNSVKNSRAKRI